MRKAPKMPDIVPPPPPANPATQAMGSNSIAAGPMRSSSYLPPSLLTGPAGVVTRANTGKRKLIGGGS